MLKTPLTSLAKLSSLRNRERLFLFLWGVTRWFTLVLTILALAMLLDWWIDKTRETPFWWVRVPLTVMEILVFGGAALFWIVRPTTQGPSMIKLAKRVEENIPEFDHRLITAIQLTRTDARTQGMSEELIGIVTDEAEQIVNKHNLTRLAETRRLKWCAALIAVPLGLMAFLLLFFKPPLLTVLLQRQCLMNVEIPRDIHLKNETVKTWPSGDEVEIHYEVTSKSGRIDPELVGTAIVSVPDQPLAEYELRFKESLGAGRAMFAAKVPHSSVDFRHRARLGDGRTDEWGEVKFIPRPTVTIFGAWVALPDYVPKKPDGSRFEIELNNGDIKGYNGSRARVRIYVQKAISDARLTLYARGEDGFSEVPAGPPIAPDPSSLVTELAADGTSHHLAEFSFSLQLERKGPRPISYRVSAVDHYGFESLDNPRRSIDITEPELPYVAMLPERFSDLGLNSSDQPERISAGGMNSEEDVLEGMPTPLGGRIPIEYFFRSPIGAAEPSQGMEKRMISPARLVYRIIDRDGKEGPWSVYVLDEVPQTAESGVYEPKNASFENREYQKKVLKNRVEFHAKPSDEASKNLSRTEGGGRFDFETAKLKKPGPDGKEIELEIGDKIEFYLEVKDRNPAAGRPPGRSDARIKEIRSLEEVMRRAFETINSENKIRDLEKRQQGVFARPK